MLEVAAAVRKTEKLLALAVVAVVERVVFKQPVLLLVELQTQVVGAVVGMELNPSLLQAAPVLSFSNTQSLFLQ
jgi:hypothetical protein